MIVRVYVCMSVGEGWRVESGEWRVESGERRVESGEWRVERGERREDVCVCVCARERVCV